MKLTILHVYPDLMNLYGSYANVAVLGRLLERLGHAVEVRRIAPGDGADLPDADFLYMGAGTERRQKFALTDFRRHAERVRAAARDGCPMLFAGTAMELIGQSVTDADGNTADGIALAPFRTVQHTRRIVGDVYGQTDLFPEPVIGFMNKCGVISGADRPLLTALEMGFGNESERAPEGWHSENVYASELTGPLLVKNPKLLEHVAAALLTRKGLTPPDTWPTDLWARQGYDVTARELRARAQKA
ncbi:MAG: hypothetical protein IJR54_03830 [Oscillibacter sp.]|nr:hypothetical protein [Oscillibacter sp.]